MSIIEQRRIDELDYKTLKKEYKQADKRTKIGKYLKKVYEQKKEQREIEKNKVEVPQLYNIGGVLNVDVDNKLRVKRLGNKTQQIWIRYIMTHEKIDSDKKTDQIFQSNQEQGDDDLTYQIQFIHDLAHARGHRHIGDILIPVQIDEDGFIITSDEEIEEMLKERLADEIRQYAAYEGYLVIRWNYFHNLLPSNKNIADDMQQNELYQDNKVKVKQYDETNVRPLRAKYSKKQKAFYVYSKMDQEITYVEFKDEKNLDADKMCSQVFLEKFPQDLYWNDGTLVDRTCKSKDDKDFTNEDIIQIIKNNNLRVRVIGQDKQPFCVQYFDYEIFMISGHIYMSKADVVTHQNGDKSLVGHQLCRQKFNQTIQAMYEKKEFIVKNDFDMHEIFLDYIKQGIVPMYLGLSVIFDGTTLYIREDMVEIIEWNIQKFRKFALVKSYISTFDQFKNTRIQMFRYKHSPINYNNGYQSKFKIDMRKSYANALKTLPGIQFISEFTIVDGYYKNLSEQQFQQGYIYDINFKYNGEDEKIYKMVNVLSCMTYDCLMMYKKILKGKDIQVKVNIIYKMKKFSEATKEDFIRGEDKQEFKDSDIKIFQEWDTVNENDQCRISIGQLIKRNYSERQFYDFRQELNGGTQTVTEYVKQYKSNYKAIHCQIICNQLVRMFTGFQGNVDDIKLIKTDCLGFDQVVKFDDKIFKIEEVKQESGQVQGLTDKQKINYILNGVQPNLQDHLDKFKKEREYKQGQEFKIYQEAELINYDNIELVLANPGSGKSYYIKQNADKVNDIVIVNTCEQRQIYKDCGFKRVFTSQYLTEHGNIQWMNVQGQKIWFDEIYMAESDILWQVVLCNNSYKVLVGDNKQNFNRNTSEKDYAKLNENNKQLKISFLKENYRNDFDYEKLRSVDNCIQAAKYTGIYISVKDICQDNFDSNKMYVVRTNETKRKIDEMMQIKKFGKVKEWDEMRDCVYYKHGKKVVPKYTSAITMYSCQGNQYDDMMIVDDGKISLRYWFVAISRLWTKH